MLKTCSFLASRINLPDIYFTLSFRAWMVSERIPSLPVLRLFWVLPNPVQGPPSDDIPGSWAKSKERVTRRHYVKYIGFDRDLSRSSLTLAIASLRISQPIGIAQTDAKSEFYAQDLT